MRRRRPTLRQMDELENKLALEKENADHFRKLFAILEAIRSRYNETLCKAVVARAENPKGGLELDDVDFAVVAGPVEATRGQFRTFNPDGGSMGRGSGPTFHSLRVGRKDYAVMRRHA